ncbi:DUF2147 domain-containing protein [Neisseriaceae bacterium B1]
MKSWILATVLTGMTALASAQGIEGKWQTIDDETKKPKAIVNMTQSGGVYSGTIVALANGVPEKCDHCAYKNSLVGLRVVSGLKADGDEFTGGKIFDPKSGKTYQSKAKLSADGKSLNVRGFVGISAFGRTQTWKRVD